MSRSSARSPPPSGRDTDRPEADLFVRLCDVDRHGRSTNVCDGFLSTGEVSAASSRRPVNVSLGPIACLFPRGHRLRLQVSAGAYPRYASPLLPPDDRGPAHRRSHHEVFHDADRPSHVVLPVLRPAAA